MRLKQSTAPTSVLVAALLSTLLWDVQASEIKGLQLGAGATGTRAEIVLDRESAFQVISLHGPDRLVVDLPASTVSKSLRLPAPTGLVRAVRTGAPTPGTVRIVFDLAQPVAVLKPHIEQGASGPRLVLEWPGDGEPVPRARPTAVVPPVTPKTTAAAIATMAPAVEPGAASSAATSRLISALVKPGAVATVPADGVAAVIPVTPRSVPPALVPRAPVVVEAATTPTPGAMAATGTPSTGTAFPAGAARIATGVPTRVATGVPTVMPGAVADGAGPPTTVPPAGAVRTAKDTMLGRGMRQLVIAIDPGHGGQDPGAIGLTGNREKDVTLAIARELARQINATPGMRAYLTRDMDVFIPLTKRARLARAAKADMFVSIHADAAENRNAKGSSVYVLSLKGASSQRARWLAEKENASDLIGGVRLETTGSALASVLLDLTQSGHMKASEDAANQVLEGLKRVGNNHKPNIERANFAVLRTSDMPAMLVETAFISNPEEERRLIDPAHQRALARAVLDGVNSYFVRQPPPGTVYSARADVAASGSGAGGGP